MEGIDTAEDLTEPLKKLTAVGCEVKQINLNALQVFAVVARHGNIQHAADELSLSRGAVSQRIKQLEIDLGVVLLERETRGVSLTPAGETCRSAIDGALAILETGFMEIEGAKDKFTIHLGSSTASKWLMPRMQAFVDAFPEIWLRTEAHDRMLTRNLGRNEIAIWPGNAPDPNPAHLCISLTEIRLVAVCSPDFLRPDWPMEVETLLELPLLQDGHRRWERVIEEEGHRARHKILNFDRTALALDAAAGGHGVAMAPTYMVADDVRAKRLVEVWFNPKPTGKQVFVSWSRDHVRQRGMGRVVDWLLSEFGQKLR